MRFSNGLPPTSLAEGAYPVARSCIPSVISLNLLLALRLLLDSASFSLLHPHLACFGTHPWCNVGPREAEAERGVNPLGVLLGFEAAAMAIKQVCRWYFLGTECATSNRVQ